MTAPLDLSACARAESVCASKWELAMRLTARREEAALALAVRRARRATSWVGAGDGGGGAVVGGWGVGLGVGRVAGARWRVAAPAAALPRTPMQMSLRMGFAMGFLRRAIGFFGAGGAGMAGGGGAEASFGKSKSLMSVGGGDAGGDGEESLAFLAGEASCADEAASSDAFRLLPVSGEEGALSTELGGDETKPASSLSDSSPNRDSMSVSVEQRATISLGGSLCMMAAWGDLTAVVSTDVRRVGGSTSTLAADAERWTLGVRVSDMLIDDSVNMRYTKYDVGRAVERGCVMRSRTEEIVEHADRSASRTRSLSSIAEDRRVVL